MQDHHWRSEALCAQTDPELFFPIGSTYLHLADARAVCSRCDVQLECLTEALVTGERYGIWGGLTPHQRDQIIKEGRQAA